jgi:putative oxygen-independent coproporphyrinogen III oxidase
MDESPSKKKSVSLPIGSLYESRSIHETMNRSGLYLHIPFCKSKCYYCDFFSVASLKRKDEWLEAILLELKNESAFLGLERPAIRTLYFGGGTPSLLSGEDFKKIFEGISNYYDLGVCEEITLEANPDDLTPEYVAVLRQFPFNRISIGVQSFNDMELSTIHRRHTAFAASEAIWECHRQGFENISIDLMYGLPGQALSGFLDSVSKALALPIKHLSAYALSWEEGSVLFAKLQKGELHQASDEMLESCYFAMKDQFEAAGFQHYELSNFALDGFQSKHNSSYWDGTPYLGIGPGAHSYNGKCRRFNVSSIQKYLDGCTKGSVFRETEVLDSTTRYNDYVVTRMRRIAQGMDMKELSSLFGENLVDYCLKNAHKSLQNETLERIGESLKLTRKGLFIADTVFSDLLVV